MTHYEIDYKYRIILFIATILLASCNQSGSNPPYLDNENYSRDPIYDSLLYGAVHPIKYSYENNTLNCIFGEIELYWEPGNFQIGDTNGYPNDKTFSIDFYVYTESMGTSGGEYYRLFIITNKWNDSALNNYMFKDGSIVYYPSDILPDLISMTDRIVVTYNDISTVYELETIKNNCIKGMRNCLMEYNNQPSGIIIEDYVSPQTGEPSENDYLLGEKGLWYKKKNDSKWIDISSNIKARNNLKIHLKNKQKKQ